MVKKNDVIAIIIVLFMVLFVVASTCLCRIRNQIRDYSSSTGPPSPPPPPPPPPPVEGNNDIRVPRNTGGNIIRVGQESGIRVPRQPRAS